MTHHMSMFYVWQHAILTCLGLLSFHSVFFVCVLPIVPFAMHLHTHTHTRAYTNKHTSAHARMYTRARARAHTHTHARTRAHTISLSLFSMCFSWCTFSMYVCNDIYFLHAECRNKHESWTKVAACSASLHGNREVARQSRVQPNYEWLSVRRAASSEENDEDVGWKVLFGTFATCSRILNPCSTPRPRVPCANLVPCKHVPNGLFNLTFTCAKWTLGTSSFLLIWLSACFLVPVRSHLHVFWCVDFLFVCVCVLCSPPAVTT